MTIKIKYIFLTIGAQALFLLEVIIWKENCRLRLRTATRHVNTDLADSDCLVFAENLNMLSANTLKKVTRVDKTNITNAQ